MSNATKRKVTVMPDNTLKVEVIDTRTIEQKLTGGLTYAEKLDLLYPTSDVDVTKNWEGFDSHKRLK